MTPNLLFVAIALALLALPARAELATARDLLHQRQPAKAVEELNKMLGATPNDPWLIYDSGVAAYAAGDYTKADEIWEQLAGTVLPRELMEHVWTQIGNVSYRLVQETISKEPDLAVSGLEQSREAYRVALSHNKRNKIATQNLALVEKQLEKIYALLAQRLVAESKKESQLEKQIEKLQAALDYQQNANALAPKDAPHEQVQKEIEKMLSEKFTATADKSEQQADKADPSNTWQRQQAREQLETALADFRQAETYDPQNQPAKEGEQRVQNKLADLLAKEGRREQHEAEAQAKFNPQNALDHFDTALQNFEQALAMKADHQDAQQGEREVKEEMEKIHLDEGDKDQRVAEQQAPRSPEQAAGHMLDALEHFEQARELDPPNKAIQDRIDRVEQELPPLLMALAKREQKAAAQAEPKSAENAVAHLEHAETALDKATQLTPHDPEAGEMQAQVQSDLARLRALLAQQAEQQQQQQGHKPGEKPGEEQQFANMVANAKSLKEQKEMNARHQPPRNYDPAHSPNLKNW